MTWTEQARKDLRRLPRDVAARIVEAVSRWGEGHPTDVRKLRGYENQVRVRVGDWRVRLLIENGTCQAR